MRRVPAIDPGAASRLALPRRHFLLGAGAVSTTLAAGARIPARAASTSATANYALRITPVSLELAPAKVIKTFGYNDRAPGPVLRLAEDRQVSIEVSNETNIDDIVHWHGLYLSSEVDGAMEEGSPMIPRVVGGNAEVTVSLEHMSREIEHERR